MNFGLAFSFPFQDKDWFKKIAIPALVSLIPIVGQLFIMGWGLDITKRVIRHDPVTLPDMDLGNNLSTGFLGWVIGVVYSLPLIVVYVPVMILSTMASNDQTAATGVAILSVCFGLVAFAYGLFMAFVLPAAYGNFVATGQMGAAFRFGEVWGLVRRAPAAYLVVLLGILLAGIIAPFGLILCVIGVLLTEVYYFAVMGHLYGQAYNAATAVSPIQTISTM
jgi:hypothetical protein